MMQLVFPEIEQDLSKCFLRGRQERLMLRYDDSDPRSSALARPGWV